MKVGATVQVQQIAHLTVLSYPLDILVFDLEVAEYSTQIILNHRLVQLLRTEQRPSKRVAQQLQKSAIGVCAADEFVFDTDHVQTALFAAEQEQALEEPTLLKVVLYVLRGRTFAVPILLLVPFPDIVDQHALDRHRSSPPLEHYAVAVS